MSSQADHNAFLDSQLKATLVDSPVNGRLYYLINKASSNWLDNAQGNTNDDNPILTSSLAHPTANNQIWEYLTYPCDKPNFTVFTLQSKSTLEKDDGKGGYMRVDSTCKNIVHGGQPLAWKCIRVSDRTYRICPFDNAFSVGGNVFATGDNNTNDKVQLLKEDSVSEEKRQQWMFYEYKDEQKK